MHSSASTAVRLIKQLPAGRVLALRLWNRFARLRGSQLAETYFGANLECAPKDIIQATIAHFGVWEPASSQIFEQLLQPGDIAVDVGANIGYFALLFSHLVGPSGSVVAIEAMPNLAEQVRRHARSNNRLNIRVVNVAAAANRGTANIYEGPATNLGASSLLTSRGFHSGTIIPTLPLTEILTQEELPRVVLIKCDIEGAEVPVMQDVLTNLASFNPRLAIQVEANSDEDSTWNQLFEAFLSAGFRAYAVPNRIAHVWRALLNEEPLPAPCEVTALPSNGTDILFSRIPLD